MKTITIENRITKIAARFFPFRDTSCLTKTMEDRAWRAKKERAIRAEIEGLEDQAKHNYLDEIEKEIKAN